MLMQASNDRDSFFLRLLRSEQNATLRTIYCKIVVMYFQFVHLRATRFRSESTLLSRVVDDVF